MRSARFDRLTIGMAVSIATLTVPSLAANDDAEATVADKPATHDEAKQHGNASFYAKRFNGRKTASGASYDPTALTAAHRTLPMGTQVRVVNPKNDRSVVVTVNDRGPVAKSRVIDVSSAAADELGMKKAGVTRVETQVVGKTGAADGK